MRGFRKIAPIAIMLAACAMVFAIAGDSVAKAPLFDVRLSKPTITITHQNSSLGTCFGGTSEPCDVFQFTSKFSCTDCALDLANNFDIFFEIATSSNCNTEVYFTDVPLPNVSIQKSGSKTTYSFPATRQGSNGRDFVLLTLQLSGAHSGTISVSGNADLHSLTSAPVFVGLNLSGDSVSDGDDPTDFVCAQVTPTFQNLN
jgi:hypothetical protein